MNGPEDVKDLLQSASDRQVMARQDLIEYLTEIEVILDHAVAAATVCNYFPDLFEGVYKLLLSLLDNLNETNETTDPSSVDQ
jgi:hypothetical protein